MDTNLRDELVNAVYEVFETVFTDQVKYYSLNEDLSPTNIYEESKDKEYNTAKTIVGKVRLNPTLDARPEQEVDYDAVIKIPKKSFDLASITTPLNVETFRKGKFEYSGKQYEILTGKPSLTITDTHLTYTFECKELL